MLQKNQLIPLSITGLTHEGSGVGHVDGMAVFVPFTAVGDEIIAKIVKVRKSFAFGILRQVLTPSPCRIENDCPVFGRCGGCSLRHIGYQSECAAKQEWVRQNLGRIGGVRLEPEPILPSPDCGRYRNKAQYPVRMVNGRVCAGFFAPRSHRLIPVGDCLLQPDFFAEICRHVCNFMEENAVPPYDEDTHTGLVRHIYIRYAETSAQTLVCLVLNGASLPGEKALSERIGALCPGPLSFCISRNESRSNVVFGSGIRIVGGPGRIEDEICGVKLSLSPQSFYQVNRRAAELLYQTALEYAAPTSKDVLLDLYCGAGAIGLSMAHAAGRVIGVETVAEAVEDAAANARRGGIQNAEFLLADAADAAARLRSEGLRPDIVVLDPPRKGSDAPTLDCIAAMAPERIVYVSCDSATLARDCAMLAGHGYRVTRARPVDMFPRTAHVECVVLLQKCRPSLRDHPQSPGKISRPSLRA